MKTKALLIDVARCMGCRGCQVACKQWNQLPAECTNCEGSYENPKNVSSITYTIVRFNEVEKKGKLHWLFAKEQCRHCDDPGCSYVSVTGAAEKLPSGAVVYNSNMTAALGKEAKEGCPFGTGFPQVNEKTGVVGKCTLCADRIEAGMIPACAQSCPTGAITFGNKDEMLKQAKMRLDELKNAGMSDANLYPGEEYSVMWVLPFPSSDYQLI